MGFRLYKCKGPESLPLIEVPDRGRIRERLSPGTIREPDLYENFRWTGRGKARVLLACPRGKTRRGRCSGGQRVLRVTHERDGLRPLLRECRSGRLSERRIRDIERILKDIKEEGLGQVSARNGGGHLFIDSRMLATTPMGRLAQFALTSLVMAIMFTLWYRTLWPEDSFMKEAVKK